MSTEMLLPQRGMGMSEATIVSWKKEEGEYVEEGETLVVVEFGKATEELPAPASGVVSKIMAAPQQEVKVGSVLAVIEAAEKPAASAPAETAPASEQPTPAAPEVDRPRRVPLSTNRRIVAERMYESLQSTAQLTLHTEVDVTRTVEKREAMKAEFNLSYPAIVVKVVAEALKAHPLLNAVWDGDAIVYPPHINIGVAVALEEGLIVPVVRDAAQKSLSEIQAEITILAESARQSRLGSEALEGGTFTVTNLGNYGVDHFTPILNSPETAILGLGRIARRPAVVEDRITPRWLMGLSLTFDHRVVDGAPAAAFLRDVSRALEEAQF